MVLSASAANVYCTIGDMGIGIRAGCCREFGPPTSGAGVSAPDATAADSAETAVSAAVAETPSLVGTVVVEP